MDSKRFPECPHLGGGYGTGSGCTVSSGGRFLG